MMEKHNIKLPVGVTREVSPEQFDKMIDLAYMVERDLISALGPDFKKIFTPGKILQLYEKM